MISKSQGLILRVSASMHALFNLESEELSDVITTDAIDAAIHFVEVCCQQTAYIAGRGDLQQELSMMEKGIVDSNNPSDRSSVSMPFLCNQMTVYVYGMYLIHHTCRCNC